MDAAADVATAIAEQPLTLRTLDGEQIQAIWNEHLQAVTPLTPMLITAYGTTPAAPMNNPGPTYFNASSTPERHL